MKKRIMMLMAVSALMVAMLMVSAVPAFAQTTENPFINDAAQQQALWDTILAQQHQLQLEQRHDVTLERQQARDNEAGALEQEAAALKEEAAGAQDLANFETQTQALQPAVSPAGGVSGIGPRSGPGEPTNTGSTPGVTEQKSPYPVQ